MKKRKNTSNAITPRCPYCGAMTQLRSADGIYHDNSRDAMLYVCKNYPAEGFLFFLLFVQAVLF